LGDIIISKLHSGSDFGTRGGPGAGKGATSSYSGAEGKKRGGTPNFSGGTGGPHKLLSRYRGKGCVRGEFGPGFGGGHRGGGVFFLQGLGGGQLGARGLWTGRKNGQRGAGDNFWSFGGKTDGLVAEEISLPNQGRGTPKLGQLGLNFVAFGARTRPRMSLGGEGLGPAQNFFFGGEFAAKKGGKLRRQGGFSSHFKIGKGKQKKNRGGEGGDLVR